MARQRENPPKPHSNKCYENTGESYNEIGILSRNSQDASKDRAI